MAIGPKLQLEGIGSVRTYVDAPLHVDWLSVCNCACKSAAVGCACKSIQRKTQYLYSTAYKPVQFVFPRSEM